MRAVLSGYWDKHYILDRFPRTDLELGISGFDSGGMAYEIAGGGGFAFFDEGCIGTAVREEIK